MRALTLWPEWAWAICNLGKRVENRSERFARMIAGQVGDGWLAIHAGKNIGGGPGWSATYEGIDDVITMAIEEMWDVSTDQRDDEGNDICPDLYAEFSRGEHTVTVRASEITTSAIVAVCRVRGVLPPGLAYPWKVPTSGALKLDDVRVLPKPVFCGGRQGLWTLPEDAERAVMAQVGDYA